MRYAVEPRGLDQATICTPRYDTFWQAAAARLISNRPRRTCALPDGIMTWGCGAPGPCAAAGAPASPVLHPARLSATTTRAAIAPTTTLVAAMTGRQRLQYTQLMGPTSRYD